MLVFRKILHVRIKWITLSEHTAKSDSEMCCWEQSKYYFKGMNLSNQLDKGQFYCLYFSASIDALK